MEPKLKARWVKALRSGKYKRGTGGLKCLNKHCCLGVLLDLVDPDGWKEQDKLSRDKHRLGNMPGQTATIGAKALVDLDISMETAGKLAHLNDSGKSFKFIADYIEENTI